MSWILPQGLRIGAIDGGTRLITSNKPFHDRLSSGLGTLTF